MWNRHPTGRTLRWSGLVTLICGVISVVIQLDDPPSRLFYLQVILGGVLVVIGLMNMIKGSRMDY